MNIRPRIPIFQGGGVSGVGRTSNNWYDDVHQHLMLTILNRLLEYGEANDYMLWLNAMLHAHSYIWNNNKDRINRPLFDPIVLHYLRAYSGDNNYYPFVEPMNPDSKRWQLKEGTNDNYNQYGIKSSFENGIFTYPGKRTSKDNPKFGYNPDGYFSGITDYRRLLGRKGDYTDELLNDFRKKLNDVGYDIYEDTNDNGYYKLKRLLKDPDKPVVLLQTPITLPEQLKKSFEVPATGGRKYGFDWSKMSNGLQKVLSNPDLYATGRLAGSLAANEKIYGEALKGIRPNLMLTYQTHRLVVGDEATKQGFYRRAALGLTKAARPFTSDADRQMAYQFEAKRVGDELRAQGDLADNQEIRRTSDESNQHQWANQQRATEVANANNASINQANSLKHNLLALKHAAQWSSVDNFLKEIEYRKRQQLAEDLALDEQIWMLDLDEILYTPEYVLAYKKYNDVLEKHKTKDGYDEYNPDVMNARAEFYNFIKLLKKLRLLDYQEYKRKKNLLTAKYGTKVTRKKKDDLLYKSTRDVVEHFRRMSKMSSDAQNRRTPKIEKLTSHPKSRGKAWKFQQGGLAPFVVYTPVSMGGETSRTTSSDSSSSRASSSKKEGKSDILDMIKELFKEVVGKGLPSDVNSLYTSMLNFLSRSRMFGSELSTDDIASMYVLQMLRLNLVLYLKGIHDKAEESIVTNDAVNEFAVDFAGRLVAKDDEDNIVYIKSLKEAEEKGVTPLTNALLLLLRATLPSLAGRLELDSIAANGIGMSKIAEFLKAQLPHLGSSIQDNTIEGYTKKDSKDIIEGLKLLLEAPEGDYKFTKSQLTKDLTLLANKAIQYLAGILPDNMKKVLNIRAELGGISASDLIASLVSSGINYENKSKLEFNAVTGKAASKDDKNPGDKVNSTFNDLLLRGQVGVSREFSMITKDENTKLYSLDAKYISQLPKVDSDMSVDRMLAESEVGKILDSRLGITFGDQVISPENLKDIMFSVGGGATVVTLPCKYENGHKVVNFAIKDEFDEAIKEASKSTPINWTDNKFKLNLANILKQKGLDSLLTTGMLLDPNMLGQFLVVEGYSTDRVKFNKNSKYIEKVSNPTKELEERLSLALSTKGLDGKVLKYDVDINDWGLGFLFEGGWDDIYHANVFIPLNNDPISALIGNSNLDRSEAKLLASEYLNYLKLIRANKNIDSNLL